MTMRLLKDPATVSSRIFVGHLQTDDTTKTELEEYFGKYGTILGSAINRGFAFIQFDSEESAKTAIQKENGAMFKNRRIDVKPAKKDANPKNQNQQQNQQKQQQNQQQKQQKQQKQQQNQNQKQQQNQGNQNQSNQNQQDNFPNRNQNFEDNNMNQNFSNDNNLFSRGDQFGGRFANDGMGQNQSFNSQSGPASGNMGRGKGRGNMKGAMKGSQENMPPRPGFRDRSPLGRAGQDKWSEMGMTGGFRGGFTESRDRFDSSGPSMRDSYGGGSDYAMPAEKNDCEIIVVSKLLTEYAELIEMRLKKLGLTVDLLFPNEEVPLSRVLGNIASRGCLYAVVIAPVNAEHHSMTLNILHGLPQEHRNMPADDAINLISRDFANYKNGGRSVPLNALLAKDKHPDAIQVLLNMLADNRQLTVLQYDRVLKYLEIRREEQVQIEVGDVKDIAPNAAAIVNDPKQAELQSRILNILNSSNKTPAAPAPAPVPAPSTAAPPVWSSATSTSTPMTTTTNTPAGVAPSPLLNDPTVQKALDSLLQGNLLKKIGEPAPATTTSTTTPLFAAFSNINNRF